MKRCAYALRLKLKLLFLLNDKVYLNFKTKSIKRHLIGFFWRYTDISTLSCKLIRYSVLYLILYPHPHKRMTIVTNKWLFMVMYIKFTSLLKKHLHVYL